MDVFMVEVTVYDGDKIEDVIDRIERDARVVRVERLDG